MVDKNSNTPKKVNKVLWFGIDTHMSTTRARGLDRKAFIIITYLVVSRIEHELQQRECPKLATPIM